MILVGGKQSRCGAIGLLDGSLSIRDQIPIRCEFEKLLVSLPLRFHSPTGRSQLLVLLAKFFRGHLELMERVREFLQELNDDVLHWWCGHIVSKIL
jgi:hypothetical protein